MYQLANNLRHFPTADLGLRTHRGPAFYGELDAKVFEIQRHLKLAIEVFGTIELELAARHLVQAPGVQLRHLPGIAGAPIGDRSGALEIQLPG